VVNYNFENVPEIAEEEPAFSSQEGQQPITLTANVAGRYPSSEGQESDNEEEEGEEGEEAEENEEEGDEDYQTHMTSPLQMAGSFPNLGQNSGFHQPVNYEQLYR